MKGHQGGAVYKNIALDIANKIVLGELKTDEKISGRSTLASMYNVSPETIRRAIALLEDMRVVSSTKGSGIEILSVPAAEKFIEKNKDTEYLSTVKENIFKLIDKKKELDDEIQLNFEKILDFIDRFKNITPFTLIEIEVNEDCNVLGKKINEIRFWQATGATIVAYRRKQKIIISPGPDYVFHAGDTIVVIGSNNVYDKVYKFLYNTNPSNKVEKNK
ncbi:K+/H+ antiporter YhaU regulatory subunit KhtT [Clostridium tetanomorphum]|uniref:GntR family transcriptional regulator n=1 Tax=Clostridium tetanomorphum TaxID=1553 RepID=A0A923IZF0_CLOTT|nr:TrkA C-terminal domain-containing protein [Clostridium tetanomorphum]KAJ53132.1 GntR family transcriptional regulator [Clostridium tetanomorphum DSM 665]MBC2396927.1 GntR family transcriptional regulator [Clostridium tetanomorphum]MBP1863106.1 K+/H+ antiporter YhaU regulatory subunit KhtT [Clostridium tetanomorphum]NRS84215.1 K+/H+ antiporter YhaU regulatory subunit KhtT [Clostridium tetanomorphum]NRZ97428.1 K+/H+ antiporter YhaU regulatory subunit KhtT [Clostridium tetanomorphum]